MSLFLYMETYSNSCKSDVWFKWYDISSKPSQSANQISKLLDCACTKQKIDAVTETWKKMWIQTLFLWIKEKPFSVMAAKTQPTDHDSHATSLLLDK